MKDLEISEKVSPVAYDAMMAYNEFFSVNTQVNISITYFSSISLFGIVCFVVLEIIMWNGHKKYIAINCNLL